MLKNPFTQGFFQFKDPKYFKSKALNLWVKYPSYSLSTFLRLKDLKHIRMSYQEIVTYKSAPAYYQIRFEKRETIVAELKQYLGHQEHTPPKKVVYIMNETEYEPSLLKDMANALHKNY